MNEKSKAEQLPIFIGSHDVCELLCITPTTLAKYRKKGMPRCRHGVYDIVHVVHWYVRHKVKLATEEQERRVTW